MRKQVLTIKAIDLDRNKPVDLTIKTSNEFKLYSELLKLRGLHIKSWTLVNEQGESGNKHPINAGAYLYTVVADLLETFGTFIETERSITPKKVTPVVLVDLRKLFLSKGQVVSFN